MANAVVGSRVRDKKTGREYIVDETWKFANQFLLKPNLDTLWDFEVVVEQPFWDYPFDYEIYHEFAWQPITELQDENTLL